MAKYIIRKHIEGVWRIVHDDVAFEDLPEPMQRVVSLLDACDESGVNYGGRKMRQLEGVGVRIDWKNGPEYYLRGDV